MKRPVYLSNDLSLAAYRLARQRPQALAAFEATRPGRADLHEAGVTYRRLSYTDLPVLCRMAGLSLAQVFQAAGIPVSWPSRDAQELDDLLTSLSQESLARLSPLLDRLAPAFWREPLPPNPSRRLQYIAKHIPRWRNQQSDLPETVQQRWSERDYHAIPTADILTFCQDANISPSWLFCWADGKTRFLSSSPISEYLVSGYLLLSPDNKTFFRTAAEKEASK